MKSARQLCVLTIASVSVATALLPSQAGAAGRRQNQHDRMDLPDGD